MHKLRKIQAGWYGKEKKEVIEKVKIENHHYLEEKETLVNNVNQLTIEREAMLRDIDMLKNENKSLRAQLDSHLNHHKNNMVQIDTIKEKHTQQIHNLKSTIEDQHLNNQKRLESGYLKQINDLKAQLRAQNEDYLNLKNQHDIHLRKHNEDKDKLLNASNLYVEKNIRTIKSHN